MSERRADRVAGSPVIVRPILANPCPVQTVPVPSKRFWQQPRMTASIIRVSFIVTAMMETDLLAGAEQVKSKNTLRLRHPHCAAVSARFLLTGFVLSQSEINCCRFTISTLFPNPNRANPSPIQIPGLISDSL